MSAVSLKARREALGLSVYELAQEFEVLPTTIYRWESGERPLKGLRAIGADVVLKRLERSRRPAPAAPDAGSEGSVGS